MFSLSPRRRRQGTSPLASLEIGFLPDAPAPAPTSSASSVENLAAWPAPSPPDGHQHLESERIALIICSTASAYATHQRSLAALQHAAASVVARSGYFADFPAMQVRYEALLADARGEAERTGAVYAARERVLGCVNPWKGVAVKTLMQASETYNSLEDARERLQRAWRRVSQMPWGVNLTAVEYAEEEVIRVNSAWQMVEKTFTGSATGGSKGGPWPSDARMHTA